MKTATKPAGKPAATAPAAKPAPKPATAATKPAGKTTAAAPTSGGRTSKPVSRNREFTVSSRVLSALAADTINSRPGRRPVGYLEFKAAVEAAQEIRGANKPLTLGPEAASFLVRAVDEKNAGAAAKTSVRVLRNEVAEAFKLNGHSAPAPAAAKAPTAPAKPAVKPAGKPASKPAATAGSKPAGKAPVPAGKPGGKAPAAKAPAARLKAKLPARK